MDKGELIRKYRKKSGLTQRELGKIIGVTDKYISGIETNNKSISENILENLLKVFSFEKNEIDLLSKINKMEKINYLKEKEKELKEKEKELNQLERELLSEKFKKYTSHSEMMLRAEIREDLIKLNSLMDQNIAKLETHLVLANQNILEYFKGSINLSISKMEKALKKLKKLNNFNNEDDDIFIINK